MEEENKKLRELLQRWLDAPVPYVRIGDLHYSADASSGVFALLEETEEILNGSRKTASPLQ